MEYRDKILALAQLQPLLPGHVAKALTTNSIMAGAMLSEMVDKGQLKVSALRVGGSPLYYVPGNESQLLNHVQSLNEKDRRTVTLLQQEKVIRETNADPLTRVSLTHIKDFAKPLTVEYENTQETFWKWFSITDQEAEELIKKHFEPTNAEKPTVPADTPKQAILQQSSKEITPSVFAVEEKKKAKQPEDQSKEPAEAQLPLQAKPIQKELRETQIPLIEKPLPQVDLSGPFWEKVNAFFTQNKIELAQSSVIKKKTEFDLLVELPSPVGKLSYYCKARSKKRISDGDLSSAYVQGQIKKLPIIYLTDGELSKQAKEVLSQLKGITVKTV